MNFLGVGTGELLLILLIILLVMGPERLPQLIRQWAKIVKTLSQFTRTWQQFNAELNRQLTMEEREGQPAQSVARPAPPPAPSAAETGDHTIAPPELAQLAAEDQPDLAAGQPPAEPAAGETGQQAAALDTGEAQHER